MHTKSILPADSDTKKEQLPGGVVTVAKGQGSGAQRLSVRPSTQSNLTPSGLRFAYRRVNSKIPQVHAGFGGVGGDMEDLRQLRTSQNPNKNPHCEGQIAAREARTVKKIVGLFCCTMIDPQ
ncbi:hypothetical protein ACFX13_043301 [Malus domestica]